MGGEKDVGFGGDLIVVVAGAGKPGAASRIVGIAGVVVATDQHQVLIEKQRLGMNLSAGVTLDAPYLIGRCVRRFEQGLQRLGAQRPNHEKVTVVVAQVQ
ncbi:hypothetical protein D3C84_744770 [compost metagenome]